MSDRAHVIIDDQEALAATREPAVHWGDAPRTGTADNPLDTASPPIGAEEFRALLRHQASSVVVVTSGLGRPVGFTATSFTSVSLRPPLVSFCLDQSSSSWPAIAATDHIGVHFLGQDQEPLARTFATSGIDRFAAYPGWRPGPHGVPILPDCVAWLVGRVVRRIPAGDHAIVLAEPVAGHQPGEAGAPLVYHHGRYLRT